MCARAPLDMCAFPPSSSILRYWPRFSTNLLQLTHCSCLSRERRKAIGQPNIEIRKSMPIYGCRMERAFYHGLVTARGRLVFVQPVLVFSTIKTLNSKPQSHPPYCFHCAIANRKQRHILGLARPIPFDRSRVEALIFHLSNGKEFPHGPYIPKGSWGDQPFELRTACRSSPLIFLLGGIMIG